MRAARNLPAALCALASTAILSFVDNFVGAVAETHGLWQFMAVRTVMALPLMVVMAMVLGQRLRPRAPGRLALRSATVATGLLIYFAALEALPVAQAGAGVFSAPIWVLLFSAVIFRYRVTWVQGLAVIAGFAGVLMLLQPDLSTLTLLSLFPLGAGVFYGMGMLMTREICAEESPLALAFGLLLIIGVMGFVIMLGMQFGPWGDASSFLLRGWMPLDWRFLWLTLIQAVGAIIALTFIAHAYRIGTPSYVAVFEYSFLIFASLWAFLLWGQGTGLLAWGGIAVIIIPGLVMTLAQQRQSDR